MVAAHVGPGLAGVVVHRHPAQPPVTHNRSNASPGGCPQALVCPQLGPFDGRRNMLRPLAFPACASRMSPPPNRPASAAFPPSIPAGEAFVRWPPSQASSPWAPPTWCGSSRPDPVTVPSLVSTVASGQRERGRDRGCRLRPGSPARAGAPAGRVAGGRCAGGGRRCVAGHRSERGQPRAQARRR